MFCGKTEIREFCRIKSPNRNEIYLRCGKCGLLWVSPREPESGLLKLYNSNHWLKAKVHEAYWDKRIHQEGLVFDVNFIMKNKPKIGLVLDVGCATGFFLELLHKRGWEVIGCDVSKAMVEFGKKETGLNLKYGTIEDLDLPPSSLDMLTAVDTIEHLRYPQEFVECAGELIKKGGGVYVKTPVQDCPGFKKNTVKWGYLCPHQHLFCFSKEHLRTLFEKVGFELADEYIYEEGGLFWFLKK